MNLYLEKPKKYRTFARKIYITVDNLKYSLRGVSASKEDVHAAIKNIDKGLYPKAFCKIIPDILTNDDDYCTIMHADGAGTKSSLAYMYWKETGDMSVWKGIAIDAIVMNLDDLLCVGVTDSILLSSTIGRNKRLIPGEVISAIINGTEEFLAKMRDLGVGIYSTGGETADVGDLVRTIIVDSTVTARLKRSDVISNHTIAAGNVIVGLSSYGQATYETEYNGGMGSNGLTSARHDVFSKYCAEKYPEIIAREIASGHEIGNHTYSHLHLKNANISEIAGEIDKTEQLLMENNGYSTTLFRPPEGVCNDRVRSVAKDMNYSLVLWTVDTKDWVPSSCESIVNSILGSVDGGEIILMHDYVVGKSNTPDALRIIIPKLLEEGYTFVTVSELWK